MNRRTHRELPDHRAASLVAQLRAAGCVFAEEEAHLLESAARSDSHLDEMVSRRMAGEPLEQILGWADFCGRRVLVEPMVFVPRRRTELLVRAACSVTRPGSVVLDLCCGSGAVGLALATALDHVELYAVDIDVAAVRCARRNLAEVGGHVLEGDLYAPVPPRLRGAVDLVVACTPYVPSDALGLMPPEARLHEPVLALDGGRDGLEVVERVVAGAPGWLAPGGSLLVETSDDQAPRAVEMMARRGLVADVVHAREFGATVVKGSWAGGQDDPRRHSA